jgi:hypothetical protein
MVGTSAGHGRTLTGEEKLGMNWQLAVQLGLIYVERWSWAGDLVLLARTIRGAFQGRGES